jgi:AcrR family transcriptional regulator
MAATGSRRQLILSAMVRVVGSKGYEDTVVADVIEASGTSRTSFYRYFEGKDDCFLAAYAMLVEQLFDEIVAQCDLKASWLTRVSAGLATIVDRFAADPALARTAVVEVAAAGTEARQLHWNAVARFAGYLDGGRELADGRELPENVSLMAAGAVSGLIYDEVQAGRSAQLPTLFPDLLFAMLVPYLGPEAAAAEMRRAAGDH